MERWWAYRVEDPQAAADAVAALDAFPPTLVTGLGVVAKGFEGQPELFYVWVDADAPTSDEVSQVEAVLTRFGEATGLSYQDLLETAPRPHVIASGPADVILANLQAHYAGRVILGRDPAN